ncbi:MAG: hypothetical protein A3G18_06660 [Rhodospirillales bacterium RIFCSPLOWO2_12_FULL_58_28]|nr:MAG: hypothetical protein A3H92_06305 [Rhodospirillales bacterium RIFCSPLOWO2_02_FULL_58_16]OHC79384.1 MAG: hypothetical protein A3G18_06660 [Rhodospirillales bacterium RIFCSPLOWO2_12_FULL_58_28]
MPSGGRVPDADFWENELEMPVRYWLEQAEDGRFMAGWVNGLKGPQVSVLHALLELTPVESTRQKKNDLRDKPELLKRFVPVGRFARSKSRVAVIEFAESVLALESMDLCRDGNDEFDVIALLFAIFDKNWKSLPTVFHLDKIHKSGFARMVLEKPPKRLDVSLGEFLTQTSLASHLARFDKTKNDGRISQMKSIIPRDGRYLVFIRRSERRDMLLQSTTVIHGFAPEWIILDFQEGAAKVNISSKSVSVPLEIANHIASAYFGRDVEYVNDREHSYTKQLRRLLSLLGNDKADELTLVEIAVDNGPLDGSPKIVLSRTEGSISSGIRHFEKAVGGIIEDVGHINHIKVLYRNKRVTLKFEQNDESDDEFVVRYSDHTLNEKERRLFEAFMSDSHGITILSTEKRNRR